MKNKIDNIKKGFLKLCDKYFHQKISLKKFAYRAGDLWSELIKFDSYPDDLFDNLLASSELGYLFKKKDKDKIIVELLSIKAYYEKEKDTVDLNDDPNQKLSFWTKLSKNLNSKWTYTEPK